MKKSSKAAKQQSSKAAKIITVSLLLFLSACSTIGQKTVSDQTLARKAAFALNTTPDKVTISDRYSDGLGKINFTATRDRKKFQCYVAVFPISDAMCSGTDGSMDGVNCDRLSKAAGRCH